MGGVSRTIKAQYYKNSVANFLHTDGLGATAVIEWNDESSDPDKRIRRR